MRETEKEGDFLVDSARGTREKENGNARRLHAGQMRRGERSEEEAGGHHLQKREREREKGREEEKERRYPNQALASERMTNRLQAQARLPLPSVVSAWPCPAE